MIEVIIFFVISRGVDMYTYVGLGDPVLVPLLVVCNAFYRRVPEPVFLPLRYHNVIKLFFLLAVAAGPCYVVVNVFLFWYEVCLLPRGCVSCCIFLVFLRFLFRFSCCMSSFQLYPFLFRGFFLFVVISFIIALFCLLGVSGYLPIVVGGPDYAFIPFFCCSAFFISVQYFFR